MSLSKYRMQSLSDKHEVKEEEKVESVKAEKVEEEVKITKGRRLNK